MKVACRICGKKFKGTHGVAVHAFRMHRVAGMSGAAVAVKKAPVAQQGVLACMNEIDECLVDVIQSVTEISGMFRDLKSRFTGE